MCRASALLEQEVKQKVAICTASGFLAVVIRKTLARSPRFDASDHRDAVGALAALRGPGLVIVDADLVHDGEGGAALRKELLARHAPTILVDARQRGVPAEVVAAPSVMLLSGRRGGDLDLALIESELLATVGRALHRRGGVAAVAVSAPHPGERIDLYEVLLELVVLGVSTGGPALLLRMLEDVSTPAVPMLIVQHMPQSETHSFAVRLAEVCGLDVREIAAGPLPPAGTIGLLRGGNDYRVVRRDGGLFLRDAVLPGNPFHPNIDEVLMSAVAADVPVGAAILTGMGQDGAAGALAMAHKGLPVIAQRPETCAVAGMPQAVIDNGSARAVQSPESIASTLNRWSAVARREVRE
jgi:two-component system, chemotaxis family, protein-glutamate methylesterase/glutaminase